MLTKKQELFLDLIIRCYKKNKDFLTIGILKDNSNYKSYNSVRKYLKILEEKGYIKLDDKGRITYIKKYLENNPIIDIPIINENAFLTLASNLLSTEKEYIAFKLHNNKLNSYFLKNGDVLIIEKNLNNLNNKFVLVLIENEYYILKYMKKDGFVHLVNDKDFFTLKSFENIIGKVVSMYRSPMD